jgi:hypothetical protein
MPPRCPGRSTPAILAIALFCVACGGTGSATNALLSPSPGAVTTAVTTIEPATRPTTTAATATSTATSTAPAVAASPPVAAEPPSAALSVEGGDPVDGQLGSYTWAGGGSDSPWLPGAPVHAGSGEPLTLAVSGGIGIAGWSARRAPVGSTDGTGAIPLGAGVGSVAFDAPTAGSWSVQVAIRFAGDLGSATYYWRLDVD